MIWRCHDKSMQNLLNIKYIFIFVIQSATEVVFCVYLFGLGTPCVSAQGLSIF
jgi:hypothetical protein